MPLSVMHTILGSYDHIQLIVSIDTGLSIGQIDQSVLYLFTSHSSEWLFLWSKNMPNNNPRELKITNAVGSSLQERLVQGSPTGREMLRVFGTLGGATINVQSQIVLRDGSASPVRTIRTFNDEINIEIAVGKNDNLWIEVTGMTSTTDLFAKATVIN